MHLLEQPFEVETKVTQVKKLRGKIILRVGTQMIMPISGFLPTLWHNLLYAIYDLNYHSITGTLELRCLPHDSIEVICIAPAGDLRILLRLSRMDFYHAVYHAACDFYLAYQDRKEFEADWELIKTALKEMEIECELETRYFVLRNF